MKKALLTTFLLAGLLFGCDGTNPTYCEKNPDAADCQGTTVVLPTSITIDGESVISLAVNGVVNLSASVLPETTTDKTVIWSTSDASVATVSNGTVTAIGVGTATIKAKATLPADMSTEIADTVTINVSQSLVLPTSVTINGGSSVAIGQNIALTASVLPLEANNKAVTWTSSNQSYATVSNGVVTGVGAGTVTITATSVAAPSVSDTHVVTVLAASVLPTSVTISGDSEVKVNNSIYLSASVSPVEANDKTVTWVSSNPAVATVSSTGMVTGVATGNVTITATSVAAPSVSGTHQVSVTTTSLLEVGWYVVGAGSFINGGTEWKISSGLLMTLNSAYTGEGTEYMALGITFKADDLFKLVHTGNNVASEEDDRWIENGWESADPSPSSAFTQGLVTEVPDGINGTNIKVLKDCRLDLYFKDGPGGPGTYSCWIQPSA